MGSEMLIGAGALAGLLLGVLLGSTIPSKDWLEGFKAYARYFARPL